MITPQQIRQSNNSFPSKIHEVYEEAAATIEILQEDIEGLKKELAEAEERAMIYQEQEYQERSILERILQLIPATSEEWHKAQQILNESI